jgi:hypothetical protein
MTVAVIKALGAHVLAKEVYEKKPPWEEHQKNNCLSLPWACSHQSNFKVEAKLGAEG